MDDFRASMFIAGSGMRAQGLRLRVISENIANADSTASTPGGGSLSAQGDYIPEQNG